MSLERHVNVPHKRTANLARRHGWDAGEPTRERWESFGWKVMQVETRKGF